MASKTGNPQRKEAYTKIFLIAVFLGGFALFIWYMTTSGPGLSVFRLGWLDFILLSFTTYRLGHLISYDQVTEPLRRAFTRTVPDSTGAGDSVEPKGEGVQQALGQLISCPICSGTWVAALLVYAFTLWPEPVRVFLTMMAVIGLAELMNAAGEALSWTAQHKRVLSGAQMTARKKNILRIDQPPCDDQIPEQEEVRSITNRLAAKD